MALAWEKVRDYTDIRYERAEGIAKLTINRPEVHNAFRPETLDELLDAFAHCRADPDTGVAILTGAGTRAFCSGGDQRTRGHGGYVGGDGVPRLTPWSCSAPSAGCPSPSSPWSPATPSAAATCCTWSAT